MKVHPSPMKRNITIRYDVVSSSNLYKKLRRLPHIFAKVLELPFSSDADVIIHETPDFLRFVVQTDDDNAFEDHDIRASTVEIFPGVTKIVVIGGGLGDAVGRVEVDVWRFRLPEESVAELASAEFREGELVVTVPKVVVIEARITPPELGHVEEESLVMRSGTPGFQPRS